MHAEKVEAFRRRVHAPQGEALRRRLAGWAAGILDEATAGATGNAAGCRGSRCRYVGTVARARRHCRRAMAAARQGGGGGIGGGCSRGRAQPESPVAGRLANGFRQARRHEALYTKTILSELHTLEDAPWADLKGKPLSDNQLARRLRNYDVKPKDVRIDKVVLKGYRRADLHDAWRRYLRPLSEEGATGATRATDQPFQDVGRSAPESEPATDHPEPRHDEAGVAAAAVNVAGCSGASDRKKPA